MQPFYEAVISCNCIIKDILLFKSDIYCVYQTFQHDMFNTIWKDGCSKVSVSCNDTLFMFHPFSLLERKYNSMIFEDVSRVRNIIISCKT